MSAARAIARQVAEFVEEEDVGVGVSAKPALERGHRFLAEKVGERGGEGREPYGEAGGERGLCEVLRDHRLAEAGPALEQDVLAAVDELELDETLDERAIDLLGVVPVEAIEGLERSEAGEARPAPRD